MTTAKVLRRSTVRDTSMGSGKVVVNRTMSLDGFTAGPGDAMDWIFDFIAPIEEEFPEIMAATGAMLIGRRTYEELLLNRCYEVEDPVHRVAGTSGEPVERHRS